MFGESDSESPRLPSPWEALSPSPSPKLTPASHGSYGSLGTGTNKHLLESIPRLAPEVEEGNVEYKLKLINPTPERFTKLVTQLKWRLLEGGGQALYEIGVSDSGQLVGLSRQDLEESLDTLEKMAGELGATVIISKEVSIPESLLADQASIRVDGAPRFPKRRDIDIYLGGDGGDTTSTDDDVETPGDSSFDLTLASSVKTINTSLVAPIPMPIIKSFPYGHSPRVRSRDATPPFSGEAVIKNSSSDTDDNGFAFDIEISTAFDSLSLRPATSPDNDPLPPLSLKGKKSKVKKDGRSTVVDPITRAADRRLKRDLRHAEKRRALATLSPESCSISLPHNADNPPSPLDAALLVPQIVLADQSTHSDVPETDSSTGAAAPEQKLIVEALVVRKLALEEVFLDFASFSIGT